MHRRAIRIAAQGLAPLLLFTLLAACGSSSDVEEATPTPTLIPVAQATDTPAPAPTPTAIPVAQATDTPAPAPTPIRQPASGTTLTSFMTADFSGAGLCAACHIGLTDEAGTDVSMPTAWRSTMMANAGKDPVWQAKVSSEVARSPGLAAVIEKKCTGCHMPMAETQAVAEGQPVAALGDGFYNPANPLHSAAVDGVSCTLCHQIRDVGLGTMDSFSGGYTVDTSTNPPDRPIFGPYEQPVAEVMRASTGFTPTYGVHMDSAEHCGTCHNLYTPYVDAQGNILGEFPEQTPYTEWQYSSFGEAATSCQSCHMPLAQGGVVISIAPPNLPARQPFFQHFFVGGNAFMLQVLADWGGELGVTADVAHFATTQTRVVDQIGQRSATLALQSLEVKDNVLSAQLQIAPLTGHKFSTGFPSRRVWLYVTVTDAAGQVIFESGKPNPDGTITGNAADADPAAFEPHYDIITLPDQVQIYEPIMGDADGHVTYTLLRAARFLKDNRLVPAGTDKANLPADIAVYGEAAGDVNFVSGGDLITYQVDVAGAAGPFTLNAQLLYQTLSYRFVQNLLADRTLLTERFNGYYDAADKSPLTVAAIEPAKTE